MQPSAVSHYIWNKIPDTSHVATGQHQNQETDISEVCVWSSVPLHHTWIPAATAVRLDTELFASGLSLIYLPSPGFQITPSVSTQILGREVFPPSPADISLSPLHILACSIYVGMYVVGR